MLSQIWDDAAALIIVIHDSDPVHYQTVKVLQTDFVEVSKELLMSFLVMFGVIYALHLQYYNYYQETEQHCVHWEYSSREAGKLFPNKSLDHSITVTGAQYLVFIYFYFFFFLQ